MLTKNDLTTTFADDVEISFVGKTRENNNTIPRPTSMDKNNIPANVRVKNDNNNIYEFPQIEQNVVVKFGGAMLGKVLQYCCKPLWINQQRTERANGTKHMQQHGDVEIIVKNVATKKPTSLKKRASSIAEKVLSGEITTKQAVEMLNELKQHLNE